MRRSRPRSVGAGLRVQARNAAAWALPRLMRVLGRVPRSRSPKAQRIEAAIMARALNRVAELGTPQAGRIA